MNLKKLIISIIGVVVIIGGFLFFLYLDRCMYLYKGFSVRTYSILPFDTKIQRDHNCSGLYYFLPKKEGGLSLTPNLIFTDGLYPIPTIVYPEKGTSIDTIYISDIVKYGYTKKDLVIEVLDDTETPHWLQPIQISKTDIKIRCIEKPLNHRIYHWIEPKGYIADIVVIAWALWFPIILPALLFLLIYYTIRYFKNHNNTKSKFMMKKLIIYICICSSALLYTSCVATKWENQEDLIGEWYSVAKK